MEEALYTWFLQQRGHFGTVSCDALKTKALSFFKQIYGEGNFRASEGWFNNFESRYGIRLLTVSGESLSSDNAAVEPFIEMFRKKVEEMGLT